MDDKYSLALEGIDLVKVTMGKLQSRLSEEDYSLIKDLLELQDKAIQISAGYKIPAAALEELIRRVKSRQENL
jgi:hypothetical protein